LRHARIERWSRGNSLIHKRHAAAKILSTLVLLISVATLKRNTEAACLFYLVLLVVAGAAARLPVPAMLWTAAAVLPFALCFAVASALAGDPGRAGWLVIRAYLSSFAALLLIATTPMPDLIAGLEWLRAPRFLLQVMQFLYRYLIVLMGEANAMRQAGSVRAGSLGDLRFNQAAAAAGVLFARSYARAQAIHRAMLARGFEGRLPVFLKRPFRTADAGFVAAAAALIIGMRAISG
jgi:cobalt/nickel transport system permease protein